ncbi:iron complex transport system substrate-binding protein [Fontibacillus phaseoli]|uniref:Iron complex transport system substrate-binding protein n=1 Tax=Fontibacillus phaseoli TaxID=1416533 RepID=A0A369BFB9_9BACL|nr:iron-siderophore ABC transporter substrate-binding protein [Fontibacillus phaseoli]RCX19177.1 iron complex transport system substrate-binding protein [Fontibacillus phaseoli]
MKKMKLLKIMVTVTCLCLVLAACGNAKNSNGSQPSNNGGNTSNTAEQDQNAANSGDQDNGVRSIKHVLGTADIEGTPTRIVALEFTYAEDLVALGVQPVGVADVKGYKTWVNTNPGLDDSVEDVGTRQEPNLEAIMALDPDLIITADYRSKDIYDKLADIAPTIAFSPYQDENGVNQYQEMIDTFNTIADVVGKQEEAKQVLAGLDEAYQAAAEKIKAAGKENAEFTLVQAFSNQNSPVFRIFTDNSMAVQILNKIGLQNANKEPAYELYGYSEKSVEAFPALQDSNFLYIVQADDNVFETHLKENQVWKNLSFVKENRTYALGGDSWVFGGPLSAKTIVDKAVSVLAP